MNKRTLENEFLQVEYMTTSQWVTGLSLTSGSRANLFVDLSALSPISTPYGDYYLHGGHRLWHSPEAMPRSYIPDDGGVLVTDRPGGVVLEGKTEPGTGIRKQMEISLAKGRPTVTLTHTLINDGLWPVELAPWAITQCRLGGTVILPMPTGNVDLAGLLPNRNISLWPYTRINDPRVVWGDDFVLFNAKSMLPPFKAGYFNSHGWLAYWVDGVLFRKKIEVLTGLPHADNNCNVEVYCGDLFVELETLGPLKKLNPGDLAIHTEVWDIFDGIDSVPVDLRQVLTSL